jgi:cytochrome c oxidase assembly protein subunit 15
MAFESRPTFCGGRKAPRRIAIGLGLVSVMAIGITGSLASLGDTLFPVGSLRHALIQDFSSSSHALLRLRLLHPGAAVMGSIYVVWLVHTFLRKQAHSQWTLVLAVDLIA